MTSAFSRALRSLGVHDYLVFFYLAGLNFAAFRGAPGPVRSQCLLHTGGLLLTFGVCMLLVRGNLLPRGFWSALCYRVGIYGTVQLSYFFFKDLLPLVNPGALDYELYSIDHALFGFEPAVAFDRIVGPLTTEWFAFFYFWYFFLLLSHIVVILFTVRNMAIIGEFTLGMLILFGVGHTVYMLVPGFGPYRAMPEAFHNPLPHGLWLDLVMSTVNSGGAMKDIFPSLHTAAPSFIAMFSFRNRDQLPFRYTWPFLTFFAANIIGATMFLRWHYIIDVFAGFALATTAAIVAPKITHWELARRQRGHLGPLWPPFAGHDTAPKSGDERPRARAA